MKQDNYKRKLFKLHDDKQGVDYTIGRLQELKAEHDIKSIVVAMMYDDGSVGLISSTMTMSDYSFMVHNIQADFLKSI